MQALQIRVELGREVDGPQPNAGHRHGVFEYRVPIIDFTGYSHQPLLDACRQIKRILGATEATAELFREGRSAPDISCPVDKGAELEFVDVLELIPGVLEDFKIALTQFVEIFVRNLAG
jgi:hypothetical protein